MQFSQRTNWRRYPNPLTDCLENLKGQGHPIIDLTESNPTRCGFVYSQEEVFKPFIQETNLFYQPHPQGSSKAREVISRYYADKNFYACPENIFLTSSTSEAYSYLFRLLADPGDQILFPLPSYPLFQYLADLNDIDIKTYLLRYDHNQWQIDLESLKAAMTAKTKAIVIVNPNNPTGSFIRKNDFVFLNELCSQNHVALICDEVFHDFTLESDGKPLSMAGNQENLTFVLSGISKILGFPQMKIAWALLSGPQSQVQEARARLEIIADTYLSVATPTQNALANWFMLKNGLQGQIQERIHQNLSVLKSQAAFIQGIDILKAEGGWYAVLKLPFTFNEEEFVRDLLKGDHVWVHPGYFFDFQEQGYLVLSLLPQGNVFQDGLRSILKRVTEKPCHL